MSRNPSHDNTTVVFSLDAPREVARLYNVACTFVATVQADNEHAGVVWSELSDELVFPHEVFDSGLDLCSTISRVQTLACVTRTQLTE